MGFIVLTQGRWKNPLQNPLLGTFYAQLPLGDSPLIRDSFGDYLSFRHWNENQRDRDALRNQLNKRRNYFREKYLEKTLRNCTEFSSHKRTSRWVIYAKAHESTALLDFLESPDQAFTPKATYLKQGNTATVVEVDIGSKTYVIKRYNCKGLLHQLKWLAFPFRRRWRRSWQWANLLMKYRINTPQPVAMVLEKHGLLPVRGYFIMEKVLGTPLHQYMPSEGPLTEAHQKVAWNIKSIFQCLSTAQLNHGDTKASNFIVSHGGEVSVIDLDSIQFIPSTKQFRQQWKKEKQRFLENWTTGSPTRTLMQKILSTIETQ